MGRHWYRPWPVSHRDRPLHELDRVRVARWLLAEPMEHYQKYCAFTDSAVASGPRLGAALAVFKPQVTAGGGGGGGTSSTTYATATRYFLPDNLNSTNVVTDASGSVIQVLDYYPYGSTRINQQTSSGFSEKKQFIAQYSDPEINLSYLQARYYDGSKGAFLSEDPVFLGDPKGQILNDPQSLNGYSYANGNPITKSDPAGRAGALAAAPFVIEGGAALSPATFGVSALIAGGGVGALYVASQISKVAAFPDGTPGYYQAATLARGSGYNTDPQFEPTPPKTPWKLLAWTSIVSGTTVMGINQLCEGWCLQLAQGQGLPPGFTGPVTNLQNIVISPSSGMSSADRTACGVLCAPQQRTQSLNNWSPVMTAGGSRSASNSSGGGGARSSGGSQVWGSVVGGFNPFLPH